MQIVDLAPAEYGGPGPILTVARFHLSVSPELLLRNWVLRRKPDGSYQVKAPKAFGESTAFFSQPFAQKVIAAAVEAYERRAALDHARN